MDATAVTALNDLLTSQIASGSALLEALETEKSALTGFDVSALEATTVVKERLATQFEQLDLERRRLMASVGFGPDRNDMLRLIRAVEDPNYHDDAKKAGPLATRWRRLVAIAERCRDANERNGQIVSMQSRRVTKTLNVLRTGRADDLTYGPAGRSAPGTAARAIGRV